MLMIENIEGLSSTSKEDIRVSDIPKNVLEYVKECVIPPQIETLTKRIDEIQNTEPPKALDVNPQIAEIIRPIRDLLPTEYLEAPPDIEQVEQISDMLKNVEEVRFEEWKELSVTQKLNLLNQLETKISEIEHRPVCPIDMEDLGAIETNDGQVGGHLGYHENNPKRGDRIVINSELIKSNDQDCYYEVLDTLIHEGRHSYQTYNLEHRQTHTSQGDLDNWKINLEKYGYQNAQIYGFRSYWMQPVEADARKFAKDVLTAYKMKL